MTPKNLVIILSDEHNARFLGCRGHAVVKTPNLDRLAARGTRFDAAYCNSPICVPSRASMATGRYAHDTGFWDNAAPYDGSIPSWGHRLREQGFGAVSVGKLHFRSTEDDNGFDPEIAPLHVAGGIGDLLGLIREDMEPRAGSPKFAQNVGSGETSYTAYDRTITDEAKRWLTEQAPAQSAPWVLFVSFVAPHFPLVAPDEFYNLYQDVEIDPQNFTEGLERPNHPYYQAMLHNIDFDDHFDATSREKAIRGYLGLCSFLDHNVGQVVDAIDAAGLSGDTRVLYASDHGEALGKRGFWGKSTMFEESAAVPMILAGPDVAMGQVVDSPVSLVDLFPTVLDCVDARQHADDADLPGMSLFETAAGKSADRTVFSEYHAAGSCTGNYMLRKGRFKLVYFAAFAPELFDLIADPLETRNLAEVPEHRAKLQELLSELRDILDPDAMSEVVKQHQALRIAQAGGRDAILNQGDFGYSPAPSKD
ncbi:sulfatase-like hydrolase/transferase [Oricola sp.]|uniref:sulfatase-like hydrolase/transferase n=1 Tax=Oricola sp. TaxID=1979950 RepID=UPI003BA96BAB